MLLCRYRIDGSSLRTAIDRGSTVLPTEANSEDLSLRTRPEDDVLQRPSSRDGSRLDSFPTSSEGYAAEESRGRGDERSSKAMAQLDVAEILRRWTHALHRLHKQALRLVSFYIFIQFVDMHLLRVIVITFLETDGNGKGIVRRDVNCNILVFRPFGPPLSNSDLQ